MRLAGPDEGGVRKRASLVAGDGRGRESFRRLEMLWATRWQRIEIVLVNVPHDLIGDHSVPSLLERIHRDHLAGAQDPEYRRRIAAFGSNIGPHLGKTLVCGVDTDRLRRCSRRHRPRGVPHRRT